MAKRIVMLAVLLSMGALLGLATPGAAQTLYTITDLGALPGTVSCTPFGLNEVGDVVGTCVGNGSFSDTAFVWRNGAMRSLGKLERANYSVAWAINAGGVAVGEGDTKDFRPHPTLYRGSTVVDIDASVANGRAIAINDDGVIVGNYLKGFSGTSGWRPVIWTENPRKPGRFVRLDLQPYPGGAAKARHGYALAANRHVQVVGYVQNSLFGQRGAFWNNDAGHTLSLLAPPPGHWTSLALGVNDLGQAVGQSHPPFRTRAVLWLEDEAHTPVELGTLPGDTDSTALAINNQGQVIGLSYSEPGAARAFLWQDGRMVELASLLDAGGLDWTILSVHAINDAGQVVGAGLHAGEVRGFLMTPIGR